MAARSDKAAGADRRHDHPTHVAGGRPSKGKCTADRSGRCARLADLRQLQGECDPPYESWSYRVGLARHLPLAYSPRHDPRYRARHQPRAGGAQTVALCRADDRLDPIGAAVSSNLGTARAEPGYRPAYGFRRADPDFLLKPNHVA